MLRTRPTTPAGLAALTTWAREQAVWLCANASGLHGEDLCALTASIDDATRGMSGLKPWSPPLPAAVAASTPVRPHPDAELLALADQYAVAYNRYSDLSRTVDRMDEAARGYQKANRKLDSAERAYRRIEDRIADIRANTTEGMLAKVKCAQAYNETEKGFRFEEGGCPEVMAQSIFLDVLRMTGTAV